MIMLVFFQGNRDKQILSLLCVITLLWPPSVDFRLNINRRCCRYNASKRSCLPFMIMLFFFQRNRGKQILSLFCVITPLFPNSVDFRLNINRRCCRYNASKRFVWWFVLHHHRRCCRFFAWSRACVATTRSSFIHYWWSATKLSKRPGCLCSQASQN